MSPSDYRKLPGDFRGFFHRNTLWLGPDHLLLIDSTRFSETYKRFYLPDIQTIIIRKTPRFVLPYYWVLAAVVAPIAFLALGGSFRQDRFWPSVAALSSAVGIAVYLYIASMFQSCTCHLITRVTNVELTSLFRLRAAQKFVDILAPRISGVQGQLPDGWVERTTTLAELSTAADRNPDALVDVLPTGTFSWLNVVVFILVLIDAGLTWLQVRGPDVSSLSLPNVVNMIALAVCGTIAIVRLTRQKGSGALRGLVLGGLCVVAGVTYGGMLLVSFDQQFYHQNLENALEYPGMRYLGFGEVILDILVAIAGLILAFRQPQAPQKAASLFDAGAPPE